MKTLRWFITIKRRIIKQIALHAEIEANLRSLLYNAKGEDEKKHIDIMLRINCKITEELRSLLKY